MTEKRFKIVDEQFISYYGGTGHKISNGECGFWLWHSKEESQKVCDKLNELNDEKEKWKSMCMSSSNENSLLWNEISILREQGAEPSDAFKKYLESISTEYTKFWQRKLEKAKKDGVIE